MDFETFVPVFLFSFLFGWVSGVSIDSSYELLKQRTEWAEKVCKDHEGPSSIDTSMLFGSENQEVDCKDGTTIHNEGKK